jgi:phospholipid/cholesterol/gamma-HCH transport system substrate-binding protein
MLTRTQKVRLGVFLLIGMVLVGGGIALLAGVSLFRQSDHYKVRFTDSVSGLSPGAAVTLRGVRLGRVEQIRIDPDDFQVVEVTLSVPRGTPIPKGSKAILASHGITGVRYIEIRSGASKEFLEPGTVIPTGKSQLDQITGKATDIAVMTERLVRNLLAVTAKENRKRFEDLVDKARMFLAAGTLALQAIAALVNDAKPQIKRALRNFERSSWVLRRSMRHFDDTVVETGRQLRATLITARGALEDTRGLVGKRGQLVATLEQLQRSIRNVEKRVLAKDITSSIAQARRSLVALQLLLVDMRMAIGSVKGNIKPIVKAMRNASEHLEEFSRTIRENPAVLLRPGLVRGRRLPK